MVTIPLKLRIEFAKYFFVSGGIMRDFPINAITKTRFIPVPLVLVLEVGYNIYTAINLVFSSTHKPISMNFLIVVSLKQTSVSDWLFAFLVVKVELQIL